MTKAKLTTVTSLADTLEGCRGILDGQADKWAESSLYMVGTLEDARQKEAAASTPETSDKSAPDRSENTPAAEPSGEKTAPIQPNANIQSVQTAPAQPAKEEAA